MGRGALAAMHRATGWLIHVVRLPPKVLRCLGWTFDHAPYAAGGLHPEMMPLTVLAAGAKIGHPGHNRSVVGEAGGQAEVVEEKEEEEEVLLSGWLEVKAGRKWKKKWAELVASGEEEHPTSPTHKGSVTPNCLCRD